MLLCQSALYDDDDDDDDIMRDSNTKEQPIVTVITPQVSAVVNTA